MVSFIYGLGQSRDGAGGGMRDVEAHIYDNKIPFCVNQHDDDVLESIKPLLPNEHRPGPVMGPVMVVGYSMGGGKAVSVCRQLQEMKVQVDELILLDPVNPEYWGPLNLKDFVLPDNVAKATCFHRDAIVPPWSVWIRGAACEHRNIKMEIGHGSFPSNEDIQTFILEAVYRNHRWPAYIDGSTNEKA